MTPRKQPRVKAVKVDRASIELAAKAVPMNWLDPLLTGPDAVGRVPYDCGAVEALLRGVRDRIRALAESR